VLAAFIWLTERIVITAEPVGPLIDANDKRPENLKNLPHFPGTMLTWPKSWTLFFRDSNDEALLARGLEKMPHTKRS